MDMPDGMNEELGRLCADVRRRIAEAESGTPSIDQVVGVYYAVSNFVTAANVLKGPRGDGTAAPAGCEGLPDAMLEVQELVSGRFNGGIHPRLKRTVSDMIQNSVEELRQPHRLQQHPHGPHADTSGMRPEDESAKYDRLRSLMSVREFIEQYDSVMMNGRGMDDGRGSGSGNDGDRNGDDDGTAGSDHGSDGHYRSGNTGNGDTHAQLRTV